jgi:hypothetical protein
MPNARKGFPATSFDYGMDGIAPAPAQSEMPCPECPGWMTVQEGQWRCDSCGLVSIPEAEPGAPVPSHDSKSTPAARRPRPPGPNPLRRVWVCVVLGIVTFGLYFLYYQFQAFREVDRDAGRRHHAWLFLLALVPWLIAAMGQALWWPPLPHAPSAVDPPSFWLPRPSQVVAELAFASTVLQAIYFFLELGNLRNARADAGLERSPARFFLPLFIIAMAAILLFAWWPRDAFTFMALAYAVVQLMVYTGLNRDINAYWQHRRNASAPALSSAAVPGVAA